MYPIEHGRIPNHFEDREASSLRSSFQSITEGPCYLRCLTGHHLAPASQKLEPMELKDRKDVLPVHIVAIIATLGTYAPLFALWSMHGFNTHMRGQWSYEAKILGWMAEK